MNEPKDISALDVAMRLSEQDARKDEAILHKSERDIVFSEVQIVSVTSRDKHNKQEDEDFTETNITFKVIDEPLEHIDRIREARQMGYDVKATFQIVKD